MTGAGRRAREAPNAAVRAEPAGIGSANARDPLAHEVRLLGALLGQVIVEQAGTEVFEIVENRAAQEFWRKVIGEYTGGDYEEFFLENDQWHGPVQVFESGRVEDWKR